MSRHDAHGIRFDVPAGWTVSEHADEGELEITAQSEGSAFWMIQSTRGTPAEAVMAGIEAFKDEYGEVDVFDRPGEEIAGQVAAGSDVEFVCFEMPAEATLRAIPSQHGTLLMMAQWADLEAAVVEADVERLVASLEVD